MNPQAQKALQEELHKQRVQENREYAQEYYPEFFGHITMLYVQMEVNKKPIQAFVDSGAQSTIMSESLAGRLGLMKLVDRRYQGTAQGVGTSKIIGRIHAAEVMIGGRHFACSLTVLQNNKVDFLFGLDNLKRHQCCIDLAQNKLILDGGKVAVPFLSQNQILPNELLQSKYLKQANKPKVEQSKKQEELPKHSENKAIQKQEQPPKKVEEVETQIQGYPESKVVRLMGLGFSVEEVIRALNQAMGNQQIAAGILFQQQ